MQIKKTTFIFTVLSLVAVVSTSAAYYFYTKASSLQSNSQKNIQAEVKDVVEKVGKLLVIPQGELPTLATVVDPEKLRDQPFFVNAKKGDKVLIYTGAKKAILYDPAANKIVEVAPINIGNPPPPSSPTPPPSAATTSATSSKTRTRR